MNLSLELGLENTKILTNSINTSDTNIPEQEIINFIIVEFVVSGLFKVFFIIMAIYRITKYNYMGYYNRKIIKWSNTFTIKMWTSILISVNYSSFVCVLQNELGLYALLYIFNGLTWLLCTVLLYFEFRRKLTQTWLVVRGFWFSNGVLYFLKFVIIYAILDFKDIKNIKIVSLIQASLSIVLLYFSFFKPSDHDPKYDVNSLMVGNYDAIAEITNRKRSPTLSSLYEHKSKKTGSILEIIIISKIYPDVSTKLHKDNHNIDDFTKKYLVQIHFKLLNNKNKTQLISLADYTNRNDVYKDYTLKKSLYEIITFNKKLLKTFNDKFSVKSSIILQLKNITDIFNSQNDKKKANSSSNNRSNILKAKLKSLETIYSSLSRNYLFFITEFLTFLNINDANLLSDVRTSFFEAEKSKSKNFASFVKEDDSNDDDNDDITKIFNFINCNLTQNKFIKITVEDIIIKNENIDDSTFKCKIKLNDHNRLINSTEYIKYSDLSAYISNEKNVSPFSKTKKLTNFLNCLKKYKSTTPSNVLDQKLICSLNPALSKILTDYVNDLLFIDTTFYQLFNLNHFIKLDLNELDQELLKSFFDINRKSQSFNNSQKIDVIDQTNKFSQYKFYSEFIVIEKLETTDRDYFLNLVVQMHVRKINSKEYGFSSKNEENTDDFFSWEVDLCLEDLLEIFQEIIEICNVKYAETGHLIGECMKVINSILKVFEDYEPQKESRDSLLVSSQQSNETKEEIKVLINKFINKFNNFFTLPYCYILFSNEFRKFLTFKNFFNFINHRTGNIDDTFNSNAEIKMSMSSRSSIENLKFN